jgi:hypothetical protein
MTMNFKNLLLTAAAAAILSTAGDVIGVLRF